MGTKQFQFVVQQLKHQKIAQKSKNIAEKHQIRKNISSVKEHMFAELSSRKLK